MIVKKGTLIMFSDGEYSNYGVTTIVTTREDIDTQALLSEYLDAHLEQKMPYKFSDFGFIKWLIVDKKLIEEIKYTEWHLSDFGEPRFEVDEQDTLSSRNFYER